MLVYAVKHKDESVRSKSRSGGVFTALSDLVLENKGVVYGCVMNDSFEAVHTRALTKVERDLMRGSKYVQSDLGDTFRNVKNDLYRNYYVLFSGTSCQIAGLKKYLGKEYDNLLCVDIVCHGVPSPKIWRKYLEWQSNEEKVLSVDFRNKKDYGWRSHVETIVLENRIINANIFTNMFYAHDILRPVCYKCPYKSIHHPGDITIADYWGIENAAPEFDDNKGVSLVLVNTEKGQRYFERAKPAVQWKETSIEDSMQPPLIAPFSKPDTRERFWKDFYNHDFSYIVKKYGGQVSAWRKLARKIKRVVKKVIE